MIQDTRTTIQIPLNKILKQELEKLAKDEGFDTLQAFLRFIFRKLVKKEVSIPVVKKPVEYVSDGYAEYLAGREKETLKAVDEGKAYTVYSGDEFIKLMDETDEDEEDNS